MVRRFSEFDALARELRADRAHPTKLPVLPPKMPALLLSQTERQRRVVGLQRWSEHVLSAPGVVAHASLGRFFCLDSGLWHSPAPSPPPRVDEALAHAASLLQASTRTALAVRTRSRLRAACVCVQCVVRGRAARRAYRRQFAYRRRLQLLCSAAPWATSSSRGAVHA